MVFDNLDNVVVGMVEISFVRSCFSHDATTTSSHQQLLASQSHQNHVSMCVCLRLPLLPRYGNFLEFSQYAIVVSKAGMCFHDKPSRRLIQTSQHPRHIPGRFRPHSPKFTYKFDCGEAEYALMYRGLCTKLS